MTSIIVELSGQAAERLRHLAETERRSEAEIVSEALAAYPPRKRKLPTGAGKYHSGQSDVAQHAEDILHDAVEEGTWP